MFKGEDGAGAVIASGGGGFEFGVDPNEDPELALALRVSMEENRARQAREEATSDSAPTGPDAQTAESGGVSAGKTKGIICTVDTFRAVKGGGGRDTYEYPK